MSPDTSPDRERFPTQACYADHEALALTLELHTGEPSQEAREGRFRAANHPDTCPHLLSMLLVVGDKFLVRRLAEHPALSAADMKRLCDHLDSDVRVALAGNQSVLKEICWLLYRDENPDVRYALAESYAVDTEILSALLEDENPFVAGRARQTLRRLNIQLCVAAELPLGEQEERRDIA